ncbi:MAG: DUF1080 domain-containing protein [Planctomycetota bacterium]
MKTPHITAIVILVLGGSLYADEYLNGIKWEQPPIVTPGKKNGAPSDAIVLFDGTSESKDKAWKSNDSWKVEDGAMITGKGMISTKEGFGDCQLHIEWSAPTPAKGKGQGRGNSGIFLMGIYEIQVLDSYENTTYHDGQAGAIYKQTPPQVNAMVPPGEWNRYDIIWTAPRFNDDGSLKSPAYMTAMHNGVVILNHFELLGDTPYHRPSAYKKHGDKLPIKLQDHGNPVRFRNIWIRPIRKAPGVKEKEPFIRNNKGEERPVTAEK